MDSLMGNCEWHELHLRASAKDRLSVKFRHLGADDSQRMKLGSPVGTSQQGRVNCCHTYQEIVLLR